MISFFYLKGDFKKGKKMNYCVSILVLVLTALPLQASENNQSLEKLKEKYNNPIREQLQTITKERNQLYLDKCNLVATEKRLREELAHHGPEQCVPKMVYDEQLNAANAYRDSNKRLVKKFEDAAQEQAEGAQKVEEQLTALKADHTNEKCVPTKCFKKMKEKANEYEDAYTAVKKLNDVNTEILETRMQNITTKIAQLKELHGDGKCVSVQSHNEKLKATLDQAQKETIKTTIVTQPTTNTNQLLLTVGATTLAVSFIMHSRYHAGNFSWVVDKLLPWNYLNLR